MLREFPVLLLAAAALAVLPAQDSTPLLHAARSSPEDLEIDGEIRGAVDGSARYVRYEDLLRLPQESYVVNDDTNLPRATRIGGVPLSALAKLIAADPGSELIVAICSDKYRANYPRDYIAAHRPILVLRVNGELRDRWPKSLEGDPLGPYFISHPIFRQPAMEHSVRDELQVPYGIVRIEFRRESAVYGAIRPRGEWPAASPVAQGFAIARQDCFRCHHMGREGGTKSDVPWLKLAEIARNDEPRFKQVIRDPSSLGVGVKIHAEPGYGDAAMNALVAYFKTYAGSESATRRKPNP